MNDLRLEHLLERYLDDTLDPAEAAELADAIRTLPAVQARFRQLGLLRSALSPSDAATFVATVQRRITCEGQATEFIQRQRALIVAHGPTGRTGRFRRNSRRLRPGRPATWWPLAVAAGLMLAIGLVTWGVATRNAGPTGSLILIASSGLVQADGRPVAVDAMIDGDRRITIVDGQAALRVVGAARLDRWPDQVLATTEDARGDLWLPDGGRFALAEDSLLRLGETVPLRLHLQQGHLAADIRPQAAGQQVTVTTPHGTVRVIGTRFSISVATTTVVMVEQGQVRVQAHGGEAISLGAEERVEIGSTAVNTVLRPSRRTVPEADEVIAVADLYQERGVFPTALVDDDSLRLKNTRRTPQPDRQAFLRIPLAEVDRSAGPWVLRLVPNHLGAAASGMVVNLRGVDLSAYALGERDPHPGRAIHPNADLEGAGPVVSLPAADFRIGEPIYVALDEILGAMPPDVDWLTLRLWTDPHDDSKAFLHFASSESEYRSWRPAVMRMPATTP